MVTSQKYQQHPLCRFAALPPEGAARASTDSPWCIPIGILRTAADPSGAVRRLPFQGRFGAALKMGDNRPLSRGALVRLVAAAAAAAAVVVVVAAAAVPTAVAAAEDQKQDDDPPNIAAEASVVTTHRSTSDFGNFLRALTLIPCYSAAPKMCVRPGQTDRGGIFFG